jgi:hypothetical protein
MIMMVALTMMMGYECTWETIWEDQWEGEKERKGY